MHLPACRLPPACSLAASIAGWWRLATQLHACCTLQNVINQFARLCTNPHLSFLGNVTLGRDVSLPELRRHFDAVSDAPAAASMPSLCALATCNTHHGHGKGVQQAALGSAVQRCGRMTRHAGGAGVWL